MGRSKKVCRMVVLTAADAVGSSVINRRRPTSKYFTAMGGRILTSTDGLSIDVELQLSEFIVYDMHGLQRLLNVLLSIGIVLTFPRCVSATA